jgi:hypothetical protein
MSVEAPASDPACRRCSEREPVTLAASAFGFARSTSVIISNLSPEGAQVDGRDLPPPQDDMFIIVGPLDTMATVVWRTADSCGIRFDETVPEALLAQAKQQAKWMSVAGWYR